MALVTSKEILNAARRDKRAVGAFNIGNFETAVAVINAAEAEKSPVIMQVYQRLMGHPRIGALAAMMRRMAEDVSVPVAVHLDHGASLEQVELAIRLGFTSVMYDGSNLPFADNIANTRKAVQMAHAAGIFTEAELGHVPIGEKENIPLPSVEEIVEFTEKTGVDSLAVAVGTIHGYYKAVPVINLELGRKAGEAVKIPLVLHGGSGTPLDQVRALIRSGFAKVNLATEFQHEFQKRLTLELEKSGGKFIPVDKLMVPPVEDATALLRKMIRIFAEA